MEERLTTDQAVAGSSPATDASFSGILLCHHDGPDAVILVIGGVVVVSAAHHQQQSAIV